jgi:hypothetical protein
MSLLQTRLRQPVAVGLVAARPRRVTARVQGQVLRRPPDVADRPPVAVREDRRDGAS